MELIPKTIGIEKEIVREVARGDKPYLRKPTDRKAQKSLRPVVQRTDLCFAICIFSQVRFITPSHLTHNLFFLFPIVFGINLILLFEGKNNMGLGRS